MQVNDFVIHAQYGRGTIIAVLPGDLVIVRFDKDLENLKSIAVSELKAVSPILLQMSEPITDDSNVKATAHLQASIIRYVNDTWGVFARSSIDLLPHQLWVCKQVLGRWPVGYVVADDVGLGKTVEAGLIMSSMVNARKANRILILTPAKLVTQWQERLLQMFDLRFSVYTSESEKIDSHYWETTNRVIASFSTLQADRNERFDHFKRAPAWDLIMVDEAHHMNAEEHNVTLQYKFFQMLHENDKVVSTVLFTGTPHRGKNYGFWSLMSLIDPKVFGPDFPEEKQYAALKDYFIRNNKQNVVNMKGEKLFTKMTQHPYEFTYSADETAFYEAMSDFISSGFMYAKGLGNGGTAVGLLLCSLQKIASSSLAAISSALRNRKAVIKYNLDKANTKMPEVSEGYTPDEDDELGEAQKQKAEPLKLMEGELIFIDRLLELATKVKHETRVTRIIEIIKEKYPNEQVLLFTEYKRTQALMMSELMKVWGDDCVTIINGDEKLVDIEYPDGSLRSMEVSRNQACEDFNSGKKRFLISTEAAGEGIDLQKNCHILIHIDLPWNPMRLHQRVGRVHRLGQTHDVEVISVRNPGNIESKIWQYLETKLDEIQKMLSATMEIPDDMQQLVLGMQTSAFFDDVFSGNDLNKAKKSLDKWFDKNTNTFGGCSVMDTAKNLGLNAAKFNLSGLDNIPKLDLPNLVPFMRNVLKLKGRRLSHDTETDTYSFAIPNEWMSFGNMGTLKGQIFRRNLKTDESPKNISGVGSINVNKAIDEALQYENIVVRTVGTSSYFVYSVIEASSQDNNVNTRQLFVVEQDSTKNILREIPVDEFYKKTEDIKLNPADESKYLESIPESVQVFAEERLKSLEYKNPSMELIGVVCGQLG